MASRKRTSSNVRHRSPQPRVRTEVPPEGTRPADFPPASGPEGRAQDFSPAVRWLAVTALKPYARNARTHSPKQIRKLAASIQEFGFTNPPLIDAQGSIIAGHGRVEAAKLLGLVEVPTIRLDHLSDAQKRAYIIADNRLAELAGWDQELLAVEFQYLSEISISRSRSRPSRPRRST